jgi:hypothetical protein
VIHTQEAITKRHRQAGQWVKKVENHSWWWATTLNPPSKIIKNLVGPDKQG